MNTRLRIIALVVVVALLGGGLYFWLTRGRESTDEAQVDAHVTPVAAQVGGSVLKVSIVENQQVEAGAELVAIDPRDYEIALQRAQAQLADAQAEVAQARARLRQAQNSREAAQANVQQAQGRVVQSEPVSAQVNAAEAQARLAHAKIQTQQAAVQAACLAALAPLPSQIHR